MMEVSKQKGLTDYLIVIKRRKWKMLSQIIVFIAITITVALFLPSIYRASAIILIEQQDIPSEMVKSTITSFADERIQIISQRVMTTQNLTEVMKKYDLYKEERRTDTREEVLMQMRDDISREMISAEVIDPRSGRPTLATIAFKLSYENSSPEMAQKVTNELVSLYLNENLESRTEKAAEATDFLTNEAERLRYEIESIEKTLADFKEKNAGSLPGLTELNMTLLERTERELYNIESQVASVEERRIYLESQLEQISPIAAIYNEIGERVLTPHGRLKALEAEYLSASAVYSDEHPDLRRMKRELDALRDELGISGMSKEELNKELIVLKGQLSTIMDSHSEDHPEVIQIKKKIEVLRSTRDQYLYEDEEIQETADNPAYIQLKARLEAALNDLRTLKNTRTRLKSKMTDLEAKLMTSPQVEREYLSLIRDYKNAELKYREIVTKKMSAELAEELEKDSKGERFSLIEPPLIPEKPVKPNRMVILMLGSLISVILAIAISFYMESIDKSIRKQDDIQKIVGMPPLATIPYVTNKEEIRQAYRSRLIITSGILTALACFLVIAHYQYKPLDVLWFIIMRNFGFIG
jgi:uncharacterized protein involved in exopolysaccharide biosynthesis